MAVKHTEKSLCLVVMILGLLFIMACRNDQVAETIDIATALSGETHLDCYDTASETVAIDPETDAGAHEGFQTEWWYYTGNLTTDRGRHFGYQLTFFRSALSCDKAEKGSLWRTNQLYFAHFAVTDTRGQAFYTDTRMNRGSVGLAGARSRPYAVWIDDWRVEASRGRLHLSAKGSGMSVNLDLLAEKPAVLQGKNGYSRKGPDPSDASFYFSYPRLSTTGTLTVDGQSHEVNGLSWFDHEWSTSTLGEDVVGWDWFSVHLDDGRDLMLCRVRQKDGRPNGFSFGCLSFEDGRYAILGSKDFSISVLGHWTSPRTQRRYPGKWSLALPGKDLTLTVHPVIKNQEHTHAFTYWEGAATFDGEGVSGYGYVEMTGY